RTIVFEAGQGKQYADSPRAIHEELVRRGDTRQKVWIYHKRLPVSDKNTTVVKRHSPRILLVSRDCEVLDQQSQLPQLHSPKSPRPVHPDVAWDSAQTNVPRPGQFLRTRSWICRPGQGSIGTVECPGVAVTLRHQGDEVVLWVHRRSL